MRMVKAALALILVSGVGLVWDRHEPVLAAYQRDQQTETLQLTGVDLQLTLTDIGPSPFVVPVAPDRRRQGPELTTAEPEAVQSGATTIFGGNAALTGSVAGPEGPLAEATVRIERHGSEGVLATEVTTDGSGSWAAKGLNGGRYRVRAWAAGGLTMENSEILFVDEQLPSRLDLLLVAVASEPRAAFTTRGDIYLGLTGTVAVSLTQHAVGGDGIIEIAPLMGGSVSLASPPGYTVTPTVAITDGSGVARFTVRCHRGGSAAATVGYNEWRGSATLPSCLPLPVTAAAPADGATEPQPAPVPAPIPSLSQRQIALSRVAAPTAAADSPAADSPAATNAAATEAPPSGDPNG